MTKHEILLLTVNDMTNLMILWNKEYGLPPRYLCKHFPWSQDIITSYLKQYNIYYKICTGIICSSLNNSGSIKHMSEFSKCSNAKDGLKSQCKECCNNYWTNNYYKKNAKYLKQKHKQQIQNDPEKRTQIMRSWRKRNREYIVEYNELWNFRNKDHISNYNKIYRQNNFGIDNYHTSLRRTRILLATPIWSNLDKIKQIYREAKYKTLNTGVQYDVDHIYPLVSDIVCGLHVPENLQIITHTQNCEKRNKIINNN